MINMEDKNLIVNTHHAFLNTDIVLSSRVCPVTVFDKLSGEEYVVNDKPLVTKLCAGKHELYSKELDEEIVVEVEDAMKFGGGRIAKAKAFVFDENPWVFVVTKDRLYATNTKTGECEIEHNICPSEIRGYGNYHGAVCDYFLFKTEDDYSIYNVSSGKHIIQFTDYIYSNSHLVIFKKDEAVVVYNYRDEKVIVEVRGQYSLGEHFYFVDNDRLCVLNISSDKISEIEAVGSVTDEVILTRDYMLKLLYGVRSRKEYALFRLDEYEMHIPKTRLLFSHYIENFLGKVTIWGNTRREEYDKLCLSDDVKLANKKGFELCGPGVRVDSLYSIKEGESNQLFLSGWLVFYNSVKTHWFPFTINGCEGSALDLDEADWCVNTKAEAPVVVKSEGCHIPEGIVLGASKSGDKMETMVDGGILLYDSSDNESIPLFNELLDTTKYPRAYFTGDGKNVVFVNSDNTADIMGLEDMVKSPFDIGGSTVARCADFNGYMPEIIQETNSQIPVWRDPVSLKWVEESDMSHYKFMSSGGNYVAEPQMGHVYFNRLANKVITDAEYIALSQKYNWGRNATEEEKAEKVVLRKMLRDKVGDDCLFAHLHEYNEGNRVKDFKRADDEYLSKEDNFVLLFVDSLNYIRCKETSSGEEHHIIIGRNVWYLNYVSFSYDSRYLAFGVKLIKDRWRHSMDGVFRIYDIKERKVLPCNEGGLYAVWMTSFSRNGDVACYDSWPRTYIATKESGYETVHKIGGKSLLCFSPTGKYIALSDQGYIAQSNHPNSKWGHQPSGNIFIYRVSDLKLLAQYNDFGEGIRGIGEKCVASAAFSSDERRLLAVGKDGVVVVRNLYLEGDKDSQDDVY